MIVAISRKPSSAECYHTAVYLCSGRRLLIESNVTYYGSSYFLSGARASEMQSLKVMFYRIGDSVDGYGSITELTEVSGKGAGVLQNSRNFRVLWHGRT